MYSQPNPYGNPHAPPPMPSPMGQTPQMPPPMGAPMAPLLPQAAPIAPIPQPVIPQPVVPQPVPQPVQQTQTVVTTTTTETTNLGVDGKPGSVWSRCGCVMICLAVLVVASIIGVFALNSAIENETIIAAHRDEMYGAIGYKGMCDNKQNFAETKSKINKGKCIDYSGKYQIQQEIARRSTIGTQCFGIVKIS